MVTHTVNSYTIDNWDRQSCELTGLTGSDCSPFQSHSNIRLVYTCTMEPCVPIPLSQDKLTDLVEKGKDFCLMHGETLSVVVWSDGKMTPILDLKVSAWGRRVSSIGTPSTSLHSFSFPPRFQRMNITKPSTSRPSSTNWCTRSVGELDRQPQQSVVLFVGRSRLQLSQGGFEEHHQGGRFHWEIVGCLRNYLQRRGTFSGKTTFYFLLFYWFCCR